MLDLLKEQLFDKKGDKKEGSPKDELLQLKKNFAKEYFAKLQEESGSLPWLLLAEMWTVEDYLTSEWILDQIKDKAILGTILWKVLEKETMDKLDSIKEKLHTIKTENELTSLESEILGGVVPQQLSEEEQKAEEERQKEFTSKLDEELEKISEKKDKFLLILDKILQYDQNNKVKYNRWGRESLKKWLDCSGLVIYALKQVWLAWIGGDSREMFNKRVSNPKEKKVTKNSKLQPWQLLFWDSKNPKYNFSSWKIPEIEKESEKYRIHHVAVVKSFENWIITIIESNWLNGVVERKISLEEEKKKQHKSDLYVWSVDFDKLVAYHGPKENLLDQAA